MFIMEQKRSLDFSYLIEMVGDEPESLIEIFDTFLRQMPRYMTELDNALTNQNWDKLVSCAHKIKPIFGYVGCNDVKKLVLKLEQNAKNKTALENIAGIVGALKQESADINKLIEAEKIRLIAKMRNS